jgi:hypothetical protein
MKRTFFFLVVSIGLFTVGSAANGRGFGGGGGYRGGYGGAAHYGGYSGGYAHSYSGGYGHGFSSFSGGDRVGGSYSGSRSTSSYSGWRGVGGTSSYDHSWTDAAGGSINTSGTRGAYEGRYGGAAAGGTRDTTVTTRTGQTYSGSRQGAAVSGPLGRTVGGASGTVEGRAGTSSWHTAFSGNRYTGDMHHYASVYGANGAHSTAYWSSGYAHAHAGYVRTGFGYYGCFHPAWYTAHPGCWAAAGWAAGAAWNTLSYPAVASYCGLAESAMPDYDYGSSVVYQGDDVYVNGEDAGTVQSFVQQATDIATQGQNATAPPTDNWMPLGVYALVQGDEKTSNDIFQLAVNKAGIIRGNYYDGVTDTTTEVYGSVDKKAQLAAWTIGKKKDRVFEAGIYNLTLPQCPCLLHVGSETTSQLLLVRMEQPKNGK